MRRSLTTSTMSDIIEHKVCWCLDGIHVEVMLQITARYDDMFDTSAHEKVVDHKHDVSHNVIEHKVCGIVA